MRVKVASLLIRADAGPQIGTGHLMRCLALAEPWINAGSSVSLITSQLPSALHKALQMRRVEWLEVNAAAGSKDDAQELLQKAKELRASWVVIDGYHFDSEYQRCLKEAGCHFLHLDDFGHVEHYYADYVLNQNLGADVSWYRHCEPHTRLLLGARFVQLRKEFLRQNSDERPSPSRVKRILVTLGGSDPDNVTARIVAALQHVPDVEATVVVGGCYPHWDSLQFVTRHPTAGVRVLRNATNMPELMAWADLAIAAGGTTAWELAYMGVPTLTVVLADNQKSNGKQLEVAGVTVNLGWHADLTPEKLLEHLEHLLADEVKRADMTQRACKLVDGLGSLRVWLRLNASSLRLRPARLDDARAIWEWANDTSVRAVSFSSAPIAWENHLQWFAARLADPDCRFWLVTDVASTPLGQVRFQVEGQTATISISLDAAYRDKNLGSLLIWTACRRVFHELSLTEIHAFIKPDNAASISAFKKAGFVKSADTTVNGCPASLYILNRSDTVD